MAKSTVHQRFEALVKALGMTRNAFAVSLGVPATQVYNIINGRNAPSFDLLTKIATVYPTVSLTWLLLDQGPILIGPGHAAQGTDSLLKKIKTLESKIEEISEHKRPITEQEVADFLKDYSKKKKGAKA
jgi:transcriptional regulator with XRE-family HTH domain